MLDNSNCIRKVVIYFLLCESDIVGVVGVPIHIQLILPIVITQELAVVITYRVSRIVIGTKRTQNLTHYSPQTRTVAI